MIAEFKANDKYRKKRKNGVVAYHEILSFSPEDEQHLTKAMLFDLAQQYIQLRGENALCIAQAHLQENHKHIHLLFSGVEYRSSITLRLDNKNFRRIRKEIERYQREHYPELEASLVYQKWEREKAFAKAKQLEIPERDRSLSNRNPLER